MKTTKKLLALLMCAVMVLAMNMTAFATSGTNDNSGSITVDNAVIGQTYTIYQILVLESYDTSTGAYVYKVADGWTDFIASATDYVSVDAQGYVTWKTGASAAAFAKLALAYAEANPSTVTATASQPATSTTVTFSDLNLGYYLLNSSLGTLCSLDTTDTAVTISEKNEEPTNTKHVQDGSVWGETNDAKIGDTISFKSIIIAKEGAESYVYHDTLSAGLTFNDDVTVTLTKTDGSTEAAVDASCYEVQSVVNGDGTTTFTVTFTQAFCDTLLDNYQVIVYYTATLNENAVIGSSGNTNSSYLSYGNDGGSSTTPSTTTTYTWDLDVYKYSKSTSAALAGATFTLSFASSGSIISLVEVDDNIYRVATAAEIAAGTGIVTSITTDSTGTFTIRGLDSATYKLTETEAPAGYNKLADAIEVVISTTGAVTVNGSSADPVQVENSSGSELPTTGGMGTTVFYLVGVLLVAAAGVLLVVRFRMHAKE